MSVRYFCDLCGDELMTPEEQATQKNFVKEIVPFAKRDGSSFDSPRVEVTISVIIGVRDLPASALASSPTRSVKHVCVACVRNVVTAGNVTGGYAPLRDLAKTFGSRPGDVLD